LVEDYSPPIPADEEAFEWQGTLTFTVCTASELDTVLNDDYSPAVGTSCVVDNPTTFAQVAPFADATINLDCTTVTTYPLPPEV